MTIKDNLIYLTTLAYRFAPARAEPTDYFGYLIRAW